MSDHIKPNDKSKLHDRVENDFTYHAPIPDQILRMQIIRDEAGKLAHTIVENCPLGREQDTALSYIEQASMLANASIAREQNVH